MSAPAKAALDPELLAALEQIILRFWPTIAGVPTSAVFLLLPIVEMAAGFLLSEIEKANAATVAEGWHIIFLPNDGPPALVDKDGKVIKLLRP